MFFWAIGEKKKGPGFWRINQPNRKEKFDPLPIADWSGKYRISVRDNGSVRGVVEARLHYGHRLDLC